MGCDIYTNDGGWVQVDKSEVLQAESDTPKVEVLYASDDTTYEKGDMIKINAGNLTEYGE